MRSLAKWKLLYPIELNDCAFVCRSDERTGNTKRCLWIPLLCFLYSLLIRCVQAHSDYIPLPDLLISLYDTRCRTLMACIDLDVIKLVMTTEATALYQTLSLDCKYQKEEKKKHRKTRCAVYQCLFMRA